MQKEDQKEIYFHVKCFIHGNKSKPYNLIIYTLVESTSLEIMDLIKLKLKKDYQINVSTIQCFLRGCEIKDWNKTHLENSKSPTCGDMYTTIFIGEIKNE